MPTDTERLDWLQAQLDQKQYTGRVILRRRSKNGVSLVETSSSSALVRESIREAIDNAIEAGHIEKVALI